MALCHQSLIQNGTQLLFNSNPKVQQLNALQAISKALHMKLAAFHRNGVDENEELLKGAALLAIDVGMIMNAPALITEAQQVISYIEQWAADQEDAHAIEMAESHAAWQKSREPLFEANRLAKSIVGSSYHDARWLVLVDAYRKAFPTFILRSAVFARLDPKQLSFRLRGFVTEVIQEKRLGRSPTESEMQNCLPEAKSRLQTQTVTYLERALPGYDFNAHPILKDPES